MVRTPVTPPPPSEHRVKLGYLRLYINDLDVVLDYLRKNASSVTLHAGHAIAPTASDLPEATPAELKAIQIECSGPPCVIRLASTVADAYTTAPSGPGTALVNEAFPTVDLAARSTVRALRTARDYPQPSLPVIVHAGTVDDTDVLIDSASRSP